MKKHISLLLILFSFLTTYANDDSIIFTIGDKDITAEEFLRIYNKNNSLPNSYDKKTVDEYIDLFINYKLKVIEAEAQGYDTAADFVKEFKGYRDQLAEPYLKNSKYDEELLKEAYDHFIEERNASHIIIRCPKNAPPADTLKAWKKINELKKRIEAGEPFDEVAKEASEGPSASKGGELGWFNVFRMVYPFEKAAYETPLNEVSNIIRTSFGYHIIKINDIRENKGQVHVKHIFVHVEKDPDDLALEAAKNKIYEAYNKLKNGEDWSKIVKEYSEHDPTIENDGDFGWQSSSTVFDEYLQVCFNTPLGEIAEPFLSAYGYHLVMPIEVKPVESFDDVKKTFESKIKRDKERIALVETLTNNELEAKYNLVRKDENLTELFPLLDSNIYTQTWMPYVAKDIKTTILSIGDKDYSVADFAIYLSKQKIKNKSLSLEDVAKKQYSEYCSNMLKEYQKEQLKTEYPDYAHLLQEYYDGILLFNISNDEVWEKATKDSAGLEKFYNSIEEKYVWGERINVSIYEFSDSSLIEPILQVAKKKVKKGLSDKEVNSLVCGNDSIACLSISDKKVEKKDNAWADSITWKKGAYIVTPVKRKLRLYYVNNVIKPQEKTLEDARGLYIADYQNYLEKEWIKSLREKHEVVVHDDVLATVKEKVAEQQKEEE